MRAPGLSVQERICVWGAVSLEATSSDSPRDCVQRGWEGLAISAQRGSCGRELPLRGPRPGQICVEVWTVPASRSPPVSHRHTFPRSSASASAS